MPSPAPEMFAGPPPRRLDWRTGALIAVITLLVITSYFSLRGRPAERYDDAAQLYLDTLLRARTLYAERHGRATVSARSDDEARSLLRDMQRLADIAPSARAVRRLALMEYTLGDPSWRGSLLRLRAVPNVSAAATDGELAAWRVALEGHPTAAEARALAVKIEGMDLGWFTHLALAALYRSAGETAAAVKEEESARESSLRLMAILGLGVVTGLTGICLGVGWIYYQVNRRSAAREAWEGKNGRKPALRPLDRFRANALYAVFLVYVATMAALRLLFGQVLARIAPGAIAHLSPAGTTAVSILVNILAVVPAAWLFMRFGRQVDVQLRPKDIGISRRSLIKDILWGAAGYSVALPLLVAANIVSGWLFRHVNSPTHPALLELAGPHDALYRTLLLVQVAIVPPLIEETMFRGVFFRAMQPRMGTVAALLLVSAVFAILHPQLPLGFLGIFVLGAVFNTLYTIRGSIVPGIVAHAINNGVIFLVLTMLTSE